MNKLRNILIDILNDEHGVNEIGFNGIQQICIENGWQDILAVVDHAESDIDTKELRFWLGEDDAEDLKG
jgi:hypothetical protein